MKMFFQVALLAVMACVISTPARASQEDPVRTVYHLDAGVEQATSALRNIRNQLEVDPHAGIVVIGINKGVDFMVRETKTEGGYPFDLMIQALQEKGVRFEACGNTLSSRKIDVKELVDGVIVVRSGMAELARLQAREGYAYIKP